MNINRLYIILLVTAFLLSYGQLNATVIDDFSGVAQGRSAVIEWTTNSETGVTAFHVQRSYDGESFYTIHEEDPSGDNHSYRYIDNDLFKNSIRTFYYRIGVRCADGQIEYSPIEDVTFSLSGILRTWGSIKAMFR